MRTNRALLQGISWSLGLAAVFLVPWMVLLGLTLPDEHRVQHWSMAWIGLDCLLTLGCLSTALLAYRNNDRVRLTAAATATIAVLDAWFDLTTAAPGPELLQAALSAVAEVTLAAVCTYLALRQWN